MPAPTLATQDTATPAPQGPGAGRPIVLLHGLTATRRYVVQGSRHLLGRGYRLVAYDARGHGDSGAAEDPGGYSYREMVDDLGRVLADTELERAVLVGSSMGAHVATAFALAHPERVAALVQITPAYMGRPRSDPEDLGYWDRLADSLERGDLDSFMAISGTGELPERWRETVELGMRQRLERHRDPHAVAAALRVVPRSDAWEGWEPLERLELPTLVVASRDEIDSGHPLAVAERYARLLPRGELLVEDPGALPLAWQGNRLSRAIGDFLERVLPEASGPRW